MSDGFADALGRIEDRINGKLVLFEEIDNDGWIKSDEYVWVER